MLYQKTKIETVIRILKPDGNAYIDGTRPPSTQVFLGKEEYGGVAKVPEHIAGAYWSLELNEEETNAKIVTVGWGGLGMQNGTMKFVLEPNPNDP